MRADRLIATLLLMQNRGRVTAAEIATELEVSVATARRDLEALSSAGVPVYPQPGRGGGWALVGGARTDLVPVLRDRLGRHCVDDGRADDGRVRLRVTAHMPRAIAEQLAGFGNQLEVIAPQSIRLELAALAAELAEIYR